LRWRKLSAWSLAEHEFGCHRLEIEAVFRIGRILKVFELLEQESVAFEAVAAVAIVGMG
jgi:hypothetical protein